VAAELLGLLPQQLYARRRAGPSDYDARCWWTVKLEVAPFFDDLSRLTPNAAAANCGWAP
jgi:hypothetical protein